MGFIADIILWDLPNRRLLHRMSLHKASGTLWMGQPAAPAALALPLVARSACMAARQQRQLGRVAPEQPLPRLPAGQGAGAGLRP